MCTVRSVVTDSNAFLVEYLALAVMFCVYSIVIGCFCSTLVCNLIYDNDGKVGV